MTFVLHLYILRPEMKIDVISKEPEMRDLLTRNLNAQLQETACVVFDILRGTSTFVTALYNGAEKIFANPAESLAEHHKQQRPEVLLGGERHHAKIRAFGRDYDFGNSPHEYTPERVKGKTIVSTGTEGGSALLRCSNAKWVLSASFLNLGATAKFLHHQNIEDILLICAGNGGWGLGAKAAFEDALAAGAFCEVLADGRTDLELSDAAQIALCAFKYAKGDLYGTVCKSEAAKRLLNIPESRDDVEFCLRRDLFNLVAVLKPVPDWGPALTTIVNGRISLFT